MKFILALIFLLFTFSLASETDRKRELTVQLSKRLLSKIEITEENAASVNFSSLKKSIDLLRNLDKSHLSRKQQVDIETQAFMSSAELSKQYRVNFALRNITRCLEYIMLMAYFILVVIKFHSNYDELVIRGITFCADKIKEILLDEQCSHAEKMHASLCYAELADLFRNDMRPFVIDSMHNNVMTRIDDINRLKALTVLGFLDINGAWELFNIFLEVNEWDLKSLTLVISLHQSFIECQQPDFFNFSALRLIQAHLDGKIPQLNLQHFYLIINAQQLGVSKTVKHILHSLLVNKDP